MSSHLDVIGGDDFKVERDVRQKKSGSFAHLPAQTEVSGYHVGYRRSYSVA
ncbi:MAG: hypothetical protein AAF629_08065 [Chloroflexota bacterium]